MRARARVCVCVCVCVIFNSMGAYLYLASNNHQVICHKAQTTN